MDIITLALAKKMGGGGDTETIKTIAKEVAEEVVDAKLEGVEEALDDILEGA